MKPICLVLIAALAVACAAQPKPIAYSVTVVSASIPSEKAPGVTWDEPGQDETLLAEGCSKVAPAAVGAAVGTAIAPGLGTVAGAIAGGLLGLFAKKGCDSLVKKADPSVPLPDPLLRMEAGELEAATPPMQNTANPIWNARFEFPRQKRMKILVFLYDVDGDEGEPIGSCVLKPKKVDDVVELECGEAKVTFEVEPIYPEEDE